MIDDKKTLKFQMMMSPAEADALDDFMFAHRLRSRAEAIRRLTRIALEAEPAFLGVAADAIGLATVYDEILTELGEKMLKADDEASWRDVSLKMMGDLILVHNKLKELAAVTIGHRNIAKALMQPGPISEAIAEAEVIRRRDRDGLKEMQDDFDHQSKVLAGKAKPKKPRKNPSDAE